MANQKLSLSAWWERLRESRDRWVLNPRLRRFATRFPLTRPFVRNYARSVFHLCAGFVYSQILLAGVRLRLFDELAKGAQSISGLAERLSLSEDAMERLLDATVSLGLVSRRANGRYALSSLGSALADNKGLEALIEHHSLLYEDLRDPVALLRDSRLATNMSSYWPYAGTDDPAAIPSERIAAYTSLMSASQPMIANEILDAYSLARHACLLDVGGGAGTFLAAAAAGFPHLRLMLFDLPAVTVRARQHLDSCGLGDKVKIFSGNFFEQSLPEGADIVSLVRIVHDHDDEAVLKLFRAIRMVLPAEGVLLLAEPMADTPGEEPMGDAYFGFYLLAMGSGKPRSRDRLAAMLRDSGFRRIKSVNTRMPLQTGLIVARP